MSKFEDLTKRKFGRLTVIERAENNKVGTAQWKCKCKCGEFTTVRSGHLLSGGTLSCGCLAVERVKEANTKHGMHRTREYNTWVSMLQRCNNPKTPNYCNYGGRGITVCEKWLKFIGFFEDMGFRPEGLTIERRDNMADYCKSNCYWATYSQQIKNQRIKKTNKTGVRGVFWNKAKKKYQAYISANHKRHPLGYFKTLEEATRARKAGEQKYWGKFK